MAAVLSSMQESRIEKAMYYDVQMGSAGSWNGVFGPEKSNAHAAAMKPERRPGFYALYAWNELKKQGVQVETASDCPELYATAARG